MMAHWPKFLTLQDNVSQSIAQRVKTFAKLGKWLLGWANKLNGKQRAYDLYLRTRSNLYGPTTKENYADCFALLSEALDLDPDFSAAWALLSRVHLNHSAYVWTGSAKTSFEQAQSAALKALEIDPECADALAVISQCSIVVGDCLSAYEQARRAFEKQPHVPALIYNWGHINCQLGYCREAAKTMARAVEIDPLYSGYWNNYAVALQNIGEYEKADHPARRATELGDYAGYTTLAWNAFANGESEAAVEYLLKMAKALAEQLSTSESEQALWGIVARAQFLGSEVDRKAIADYIDHQIRQPEFQPTGITVNGAAQFGLIESFFEQWRETYFEKGNLGLLLWSDFEWAQAIRSHTGFLEFAEQEGWTAVWEKFGEPDRLRPVV